MTKTRLILAAVALIAIVAGIAATPHRRPEIVTLIANPSQTYIVTQTNAAGGITALTFTNGITIAYGDASHGTPYIPVWGNLGGTNEGYHGNVSFSDTLASYLDHGFRIIHINTTGTAYGLDPITCILQRD